MTEHVPAFGRWRERPRDPRTGRYGDPPPAVWRPLGVVWPASAPHRSHLALEAETGALRRADRIREQRLPLSILVYSPSVEIGSETSPLRHRSKHRHSLLPSDGASRARHNASAHARTGTRAHGVQAGFTRHVAGA